MNGRVVVLSPSMRSLYTMCVTEMLARAEISVEAVIVRRFLQPRRLASELRMYGAGGLAERIINRLIFRERGRGGTTAGSFSELKAELDIADGTVKALTRRRSIPLVYCNSLNDDTALAALKSHAPDLVLFTGGGIIRAPVLELAGVGIINCHMGLLPEFRGMDVIEWPAILNRPDSIGITTHFMDTGIDTGPILMKRKIPPASGESLRALRVRFERNMCKLLVESALGALSGTLEPEVQAREDGLQFFQMHPRLKAVALARSFS